VRHYRAARSGDDSCGHQSSSAGKYRVLGPGVSVLVHFCRAWSSSLRSRLLIAFHRRLALIGCGFSELSGLAEILAGGLSGSDAGVKIRGVLAVGARKWQIQEKKRRPKTRLRTPPVPCGTRKSPRKKKLNRFPVVHRGTRVSAIDAVHREIGLLNQSQPFASMTHASPSRARRASGPPRAAQGGHNSWHSGATEHFDRAPVQDPQSCEWERVRLVRPA
jgi:hypothetical protein